MSNDIEPKLLDHLQVKLWNDLSHDLRHAINGCWSMAAESTVTNIVWVARQRGVTPADQVQIPLLASGVYTAVCELVPTKSVIDIDLTRYAEYFGLAHIWAEGSVPEIRKMTVEEFAPDES